MATKFPRRTCLACKSKQVSWKMPSIQNAVFKPVTFLCWDCSQRFYFKLQKLKIEQPPDKKFLLSVAFKIVPKPKQETLF